MTRTLCQVCLAGLLMSAALPLPAAAQYAIKDLGMLGGTYSEANAINERGQVVGRSDTASSDGFEFHAFVWERGRMTDLGTLPGGRYSLAYGINSSGQIVGVSETTAGNCQSFPFNACEHAFLWEHGTMTDLGALGGPFSRAVAINDRGQVVGLSTTSAAGDYHAVLWEAGAIVDLGTLPGDDFAQANAISNGGLIVGWSSGVTTRAFTWEDGRMSELGTLPGGTFSTAVGTNNRGQIVGVGDDAGTRPPVVWNKGTARMLPLVPGATSGQASGINARGQAVGNVLFPDEDVSAVLWQKEAVIELPALAPPANTSNITVAAAINNAGQIVGSSQGHAVLWSRGPARR